MTKKKKIDGVADAIEQSDTDPVDTEAITTTPETVKLRAWTVLDGEFYPKWTVLEVNDKIKAQLKPFRYFW